MSKKLHRCAVAAMCLAITPVWAADQTAVWTGLGLGNNWTDTANWSIDPDFPNNNGITYDAQIGEGVGEVVLDGATIALLALDIGTGTTLTDGIAFNTLALGADSTNDGTIDLFTVRIDNDLSLNGTGQVFGAKVRSDNGSTLTVGSDQTLIGATSESIDIINRGTLIADAAPFAGGNILLSGNLGPVTLTHHGTAEVRNNGIFQVLQATLVSDGAFNIEAGSSVQVGQSTLSLLDGTSINGGQFFISSAPTDLAGGLTNNGFLSLSGGFSLTLDGDVDFGGTGSISFDTPQDHVLVGTNAGDTLTVGPGQTITTGGGRGRFEVDVILDGAVDATGSANNRLEFAGVTELNGTVAAAGGSSVTFSNTVTGPGAINVDGTSFVEFRNAGDALPGVGGTGEIRYTAGVMTELGSIAGIRDVAVSKAFGEPAAEVGVVPAVGQLDDLSVTGGSSIDFRGGLSQLNTLDTNSGEMWTVGDTSIANAVDLRFATLGGRDAAVDRVVAQGDTQLFTNVTFDAITFDVVAGANWRDVGTTNRTLSLTNGAVLNNLGTGFNLDARVGTIDGDGELNNLGTLNQLGALNRTTVNVPLFNAETGEINLAGRMTLNGALDSIGAIHINAGGYLDVLDGSDIAGPVTIAAGSTLRLGGLNETTHTVTSQATLGGPGTIQVGVTGGAITEVAFSGEFAPVVEDATTLNILTDATFIMNIVDDGLEGAQPFALPAMINVDQGTLRLVGHPAPESPGLAGRGRSSSGVFSELFLRGLDVKQAELDLESAAPEAYLATFLLVVDEFLMSGDSIISGGEGTVESEVSTLGLILRGGAVSNARIRARERGEVFEGVTLDRAELEIEDNGLVEDETTVVLNNGSTASFNNTEVGTSVAFRSDGTGEVNFDGETTLRLTVIPTVIDGTAVNVGGSLVVPELYTIELENGAALDISEPAQVELRVRTTIRGQDGTSMVVGGLLRVGELERTTPAPLTDLVEIDTALTIPGRLDIRDFAILQSPAPSASSIGTVSMGEGVLWAIERSEATQTIAIPRVVTTNGQAATIRIQDNEGNPLGNITFEGQVEANGLEFSNDVAEGFISQFTVIASPSHITVAPHFTFVETTEMHLSLGGLAQGTEYDWIEVEGNLFLDGQLLIDFLDGFENDVSAGDLFTIFSAGGSIFGAFDNIANGDRIVTDDGVGSFLVSYGDASPFAANTVVLSQYQLVPEPATPGVLSLLSMTLLGRRRRG